MFIWLWAQWWYGAGWGWAWQRAVIDRVAWCNNAFSLSRLVETWAAPYKQIAVGKVRGSIGDQLRAIIDRLISRVIGFLVRTILILVGAFLAFLAFISGMLFLIVWPLLPFVPVVGLVLFASGAGQ